MPTRTAIAKGHYARACRADSDPAEKEARRRDFAAAKLTDITEKILADWPPLTDQQVEDIVAMLRAGAA
jgi:hypothetical protein